MEVFGEILDTLLPEDCTIHFRHCFAAKGVVIPTQFHIPELTSYAMQIGNDGGWSMISDLAKWFNRPVTGCTGMISYTIPYGDNSNGAYEHPGVDYGISGDLWQATPTDYGYILFTMIWSPYWHDRNSWRPNPWPQPY